MVRSIMASRFVAKSTASGLVALEAGAGKAKLFKTATAGGETVKLLRRSVVPPADLL